MASRRTAYPIDDRLVDLEAGRLDTAGLKEAGWVTESFYDDREHSRLNAELQDFALDSDTTLTRATRDRDRAFPRDVTAVDDRKRRRLPELGAFRATLSARQRRERSAAKNRVQRHAPKTSARALEQLITEPDAATWQRMNSLLSRVTGNVQYLEPRDRKLVQRVDRLIQAYERDSDRGHVVYVVARLPFSAPVDSPDKVPVTLLPGARLSFDQFTMGFHTLEEATTHARASVQEGDHEHTTVVLEVETARGIYLGRSDSVPDTAHLLPRGLALQVQAIDPAAPHPATIDGDGFAESLLVQCTDSPRSPDYQPPIAARERIRADRARRRARSRRTPHTPKGETS